MLEQNDITLQQPLDLALSLNQAQEHATRLNHVKHLATTQEIRHNINQQEYQIPPPTSTSAAMKRNFHSKTCFFCGGLVHNRDRCPAKDIQCFLCGKTGHFSRVCHSKKKIKTSTSMYDPIVSSIFVGFPKCLKASVVEGTVNGVSVQILMDTGFSKSYINHRLLKGLKLSLEREPSAITMASTSHSVQVKGAILINLKVFNKNYPKFKLGVMEELCTEVILGLDFMKLNSKSNLKCMDLKKLYPLIAL